MHLYALAEGTATCPTDSDDSGLIDAVEGEAAYGESVLALIGPGSVFPTAEAEGTISYDVTFVLTAEQIDALADLTQTVLVIHGMMFDLDGDGEDGPIYAAAIPAACGAVVAVDTEA